MLPITKLRNYCDIVSIKSDLPLSNLNITLPLMVGGCPVQTLVRLSAVKGMCGAGVEMVTSYSGVRFYKTWQFTEGAKPILPQLEIKYKTGISPKLKKEPLVTLGQEHVKCGPRHGVLLSL